MQLFDKSSLMGLYVVLGILLALSPHLFRFVPVSSGFSRLLRTATLSVTVAAMIWVMDTLSAMAWEYLCFCAVVIVASSFQDGKPNIRYAVGTFVGLTVSTTLLWWKEDQTLGKTQLPFTEFGIATFIFIISAQILSDANFLAKEKKHIPSAFFFLVFLVGSALFSFQTGLLFNTNEVHVVWHHWGAYIAPAESVLAGARLFHDIPAQYGLGPTALLAMTCGSNCWNAMYYAVAFSTLLFSFSIWLIAYSITESRLTTKSGLMLVLISLVTCFLWVGNQLPITTPSVSGLRFLPVTALTAALVLHAGRQDFHSAPRWGHLAWAAAALWSPESAFYATFVWWPYFLWTQLQDVPPKHLIKYSLRAFAILVSTLVLLAALFIAAYYLKYGVLPLADGYFAYIISPPGLLPVNPKGSILFGVAVLAVGCTALYHDYRVACDYRAARRTFLALLLFFGCLSYFLGRSHDNNMSNLLPFQFLVLLSAFMSLASDKLLKGFMVAMLACLLAWTPLFGWEVWEDMIEHGELMSYRQKDFVATYSAWPDDVHKAINYIQANYGEPVTVLDGKMNLVLENKGAVWSAIHDSANFVFLPRSLRRKFLANTAAVMPKNGWLLISNNPLHQEISPQQIRELGEDFDTAYLKERGFISGNYLAIRYVPRPTPSIPRPPS
jgi:hypothetical protein